MTPLESLLEGQPGRHAAIHLADSDQAQRDLVVATLVLEPQK